MEFEDKWYPRLCKLRAIRGKKWVQKCRISLSPLKSDEEDFAEIGIILELCQE